MTETMLAARMHDVSAPMLLEQIPTPKPGPSDVRVRVKACNIVPNLANVLQNWTTWFPQNPLPSLPAIFGLDPAGVVDAVGTEVKGFRPGDRVYVNPGRYCDSCRECRSNNRMHCQNFAFSGYFGLTPTSGIMLDRYPYGGLAEYTIAPQYSLVRLPENISFETGARLGYLGTGFAALRKAGVGPTTTVLINGISGTLGLGVALFALALGAPMVLGTGRNRELLDKVKALAPQRIHTHSLADGPVDNWVRELTAEGVDVHIDSLGPGADHAVFNEGLKSLRRGGVAVNIGATAGPVPIDVHHMMDQQQKLIGSCWFSAGEGQAMVDMAASGAVDLSVFEHIVYPLEQVNDAISGISVRNGGFSNFIISPS
jgi:D-arabinose 1-dehydrogenase-like Zn-dependent alcohol dehydrogenase